MTVVHKFLQMGVARSCEMYHAHNSYDQCDWPWVYGTSLESNLKLRNLLAENGLDRSQTVNRN